MKTIAILLLAISAYGNAGLLSDLAGTTLGMVRGGINVINNTFAGIMNGALSVTDRIRVSLEEFRRYMITGIPEIGLPILDPLLIDRIDLNITHEALNLKGYVEDVRVKYLSKFRLDHINYRLPESMLELNVTFPFLDIRGYYDIKGDVGELFSIFGNGRFWIELYNLSIDTLSKVRIAEAIYPPIYVESIKITPKIRGLTNNFEGLMRNEELGDTFNKAITKLAPTALDTLWPEIEPEVTKTVTAIINNKLQDLHFSNFIGRILDVFKLNFNQGRINIHN